MVGPRKSIILAVFILISANASADDEKKWTAMTGLSYRNSNFNLPNNKFGNESWSGNIGLSRLIDENTSVGGSILYSVADTRYATASGSADFDTTSLSLFAMRRIGYGLYAYGTLGYGKSQIDTQTSVVNYDNDATFKTASLGLTQYIPISETLMGNVNVSYSHISSDSDRFITNLGDAVPSSNNTLNYVTVGGQVTWQLNYWAPFVKLDYNKASREFIEGAGDDDYFSYGFGTRYKVNNETSIGIMLGSVFDRRYSNETSANISLSHQF